MTAQFSFNRDANGNETLVLFGSQGPRIIGQTHANFDRIKSALLDPHVVDVDEQELYTLADAATTALATLRRLSDRVLIKGDVIFYDGEAMENRLTKHLVRMIADGDENFGGYVAFLHNLMDNPSRKSRKGLFRFLERHDLVITSDGRFIGYKGVGSDGKSLTAGNEDVTVTLADGTVETHRGHIPNPVGAVVEMPRNLVDPDRENHCSVGLHIGNHRYANQWGNGGMLLTVAVSPRDVVEVPTDSNAEKIRAHRYEVIEVNENRERYEGTSFVENDEPSLDDDGPTFDDCTCCGSPLDGEDVCDACGYDAAYGPYDDSFDGPAI